jgi:triosephosphate isomerase
MRPLIVAGNWKMNTTPADAGRLAATSPPRPASPA